MSVTIYRLCVDGDMENWPAPIHLWHTASLYCHHVTSGYARSVLKSSRFIDKWQQWASIEILYY